MVAEVKRRALQAYDYAVVVGILAKWRASV
jgi:hypothetical protein